MALPPEIAKARRDARYKRRRYLLDAIKRVPCMDCRGVFPPECMDFDHVRGEKKFNLSTNCARSWEIVLEEVAKCDIVCSNCHRIRTKARKCH